MARKDVGKWGENLAVEYLTGLGYAIIDRNWRMHHYELDIIAMTGSYIVFVEVKTRTSDDYDPVEAVDLRKQRRIASSANVFLTRYDMPHQFRFDIIAITGNPENYTLEHIPDAFFPPLKRF